MRTALLASVAIVLGTRIALGQVWPTVQPIARQVAVDFRSERIDVDVPIMTIDGRVAYYLACRGGSERYLDSLPVNWVGPLMCTLAEGDHPSEASLLSEDDSAAWYSRGQFRAEHLVGACGQYPEYGTTRSFRLRGMRLTLEAKRVTGTAEGVHPFVLAIAVVPDPTAATARAEQPGFLDPHRRGRSCETIVRGRDPRMCRNANGSYEPCKD